MPPEGVTYELPGTVGTSFTFPPADFITEKGNCHTCSRPERGPRDAAERPFSSLAAGTSLPHGANAWYRASDVNLYTN